MTAAEAKASAKAHKAILDLQNQIVDKIQQGSVKDAWNTIIEAIRHGEDYCTMYYIPAGLQAILIANKYQIEKESEGEEGPEWYVISWKSVL